MFYITSWKLYLSAISGGTCRTNILWPHDLIKDSYSHAHSGGLSGSNLTALFGWGWGGGPNFTADHIFRDSAQNNHTTLSRHCSLCAS